MKPVYTLTLVLASCQPFDFTEDNPQPPKDALQPKMEAALTATIPVRPDHTVFVWFENKGYSSIVGNANAPYINTLIKRGTLFTNAFGRTHPSYPNYIAFFSGSRQGVRTDDCIDGTPFTCKTLYNVLYDKGVSFAWYSEGLPFTGSRTCAWGHYREKHNPTTIFSTLR